jgi:hypothetical protein
MNSAEYADLIDRLDRLAESVRRDAAKRCRRRVSFARVARLFYRGLTPFRIAPFRARVAGG